MSHKELPDRPPSYLKGTAAAMWRRLVPMIKADPVVNDMDRTVVEAFCTNYQLMRQAYDDIQENGITKPIYKTTISPVTGDVVAKDFTGFKRNPATQILDSATAKLRSLGSELGLTPQSRADLMNIRADDDSDGALEAMQKFFKGDAN